jgi:hypothetical protein
MDQGINKHRILEGKFNIRCNENRYQKIEKIKTVWRTAREKAIVCELCAFAVKYVINLEDGNCEIFFFREMRRQGDEFNLSECLISDKEHTLTYSRQSTKTCLRQELEVVNTIYFNSLGWRILQQAIEGWKRTTQGQNYPED